MFHFSFWHLYTVESLSRKWVRESVVCACKIIARKYVLWVEKEGIIKTCILSDAKKGSTILLPTYMVPRSSTTVYILGKDRHDVSVQNAS